MSPMSDENRYEYMNNSVESVTPCCCDECGELVDKVIVMEDTLATDETRSNGNSDDMYKTLCVECAFSLFESSDMRWQAL